MTKRRPPLSFELALTKVAGLIGWPAVAAIVGHGERAVRNWSDPDAAAGIRMDAAERLDIAYQEAGGSGAPFLECYATRLKSAMTDAFGSAEAIAVAAARAAKECGEGVAASIAASQPGADRRVFEDAQREIEEGIESLTATLANIRRRMAAEEPLLEEIA